MTTTHLHEEKIMKPTGILRQRDNRGYDVFFYPIKRPLSYSRTRLGSHVKLVPLAYAPYLGVEVVTLTDAEQAELQPVGLYVSSDEAVIITPETMLKHLQAVALALAGQFVDEEEGK